MSFFEKFFGYFKSADGTLEPYSDGLGHGFMDIRHLLWIIITIAIVIILIKLSKKHKKDVNKFCKGILIFMFVQRLINQIVRAVLMIENPFWRALTPAHLCTIMIYLLPIVVVFDIKKIKKPVYFFSVLGGIITILDGDYFGSLFMPFGTLEGIFAHTVITTTAITLMHNEKEHFNLKDVKLIYFMMAIMTLWATSINMILLHMGHGPNYMYLVRNMLPIGGKYFVYIYLVIFTIIVFATYILNNLKKKRKVKRELKANKFKILIASVMVVAYTYVLIILNNIFN